VAGQPELSFAGLLRLLRGEARLTQEELAEAARLSPRSISDLERGINRTARKDTALLLAEALGLTERVAELFVAAARGKASPAEVLQARSGVLSGVAAAAATRGLPRDISSFTGREGELGQLVGTLTAAAVGGGVVGIHAIGGMAGVGKTAFAVHAAHRLAGAFPEGQFFLPLHAHTLGQRPVDPADALASLLLIAGLPAAQIPPGAEARAARWRDAVAGKKILLLLDDAAGHEQVRPLLPGSAGSLVLVTSRRRLAALEDVTVISLDTLAPPEAATLLARLAARTGLHSGDAAVAEITRLCGYLPLAIGMLASQLRYHPAWTAASLAADLAAARDRLAVMHAENLSVAAAFELSYQDLSPALQRLFRRLGLVPGPSFDAYAAAALDGTTLDAARRGLDELYDYHLLTELTPGRYQLHDLLREHARALAAANSPAESVEAIDRLVDYYLHTALAAGRHFARPPAARRQPPGHPPAQAPNVSTPGLAGSWLDTERANLHAAADYAAGHGQPRNAIAIPAAMSGFLIARGYWDQSAALHRTALASARQADDRLGEADTLVALGILQGGTGDHPAAATTLARAVALYRDAGDLPGQAHALNQLGYLYVLTGDYPAAAASTEQALTLARGASDRFVEADILIHLGLVHRLTGDYPAAAASQQRALALCGDLGDLEGQAEALNCLGQVQQETADYSAAAASQQRALELSADLGSLDGQAYALNDLGVVQQQTGDYPAAAASHEQALALFRETGNRLGQAEALNRLGELSSRTSATGQAREHHAKALAIARDLCAPLEEARSLEGTGRACLQDGNNDEGLDCLRQALTVYQRIGAPGAHRVEETLRDPSLAENAEHLLWPGSGSTSSAFYSRPGRRPGALARSKTNHGK
jgi:tetratricopeptide (TPR) repeat protein/transcriptional regulator with XRE-family HTH domain